MPIKKQTAWIVTVDMGYGHQRASDPLKKIAEGGEIISANSYPGIPKKDKELWAKSKTFYEFISRFKKVPVIGRKAFELFDKLQAIEKFYPKRDLSKPNIQLKQIYKMFKDGQWGEHLIEKLSKKKLPFVTTFFATAFMAEYYNYPGEIYCLVTDTDVSRTWVSIDPKTSRINYLAPSKRVMERLKLYGIREDKILLTGFPLPEENTGKNMEIIKEDLGKRLIHLDPQQVYIKQYKKTILSHLGRGKLKTKPTRPLTITFAVGGAGAQRELGAEIIASLHKEIADGKVIVNLVAGTHSVVRNYFKDKIKSLRLSSKLNKGANVVYSPEKNAYFKKFNKILRTTDIIWTKPSELSFYCALGLPIIMAPPIGSQEFFNRKWLESLGSGIRQEDPKHTAEWLFDWLNSGWLAEAAMEGFLEAPRFGTFNVQKVIFGHKEETKGMDMVMQY